MTTIGSTFTDLTNDATTWPVCAITVQYVNEMIFKRTTFIKLAHIAIFTGDQNEETSNGQLWFCQFDLI
jgi:hypothetical protein